MTSPEVVQTELEVVYAAFWRHLTVVPVNKRDLIFAITLLWNSADLGQQRQHVQEMPCGACRSELPESFKMVLDARLGHERLPQDKHLTFVYDAYVRVTARSKDEVDRRLAQLESVYAMLDDVSLSVLDAFGIEDPDTGEEIRPVG